MTVFDVIALGMSISGFFAVFVMIPIWKFLRDIKNELNKRDDYE